MNKHLGLDGVRGTADHHIGEGSQHGHILGGLVGDTLRAIGIACPYRDDAHIAVVIDDIVADLFDTAQGGEITDGIAIDYPAVHGQTTRNARHVLFADAYIQETLGESFCKGFHHMEAQIAYEQEDALILARFLYQLIDKCRSHASSSKACFSCSSLGLR